MTREEAIKKLQMLPWQAVYELAIAKGIDKEEVRKKEKSEIIARVLLTSPTAEEINSVLDNYIYGNRVTFTLWGFAEALKDEDYAVLRGLEGTQEAWIDDGFRNLQYISVNDCPDRLEIVYNYSKEYNYMNEEGRTDSVWEMHRGCLWVGKTRNYLAIISKHEKMMQYVVRNLAQLLQNKIQQIKPPKKAIERCTNFRAISRIVLQGTNGEKTTIANPGGFTDEQNEEVERIRAERYDTSGSYIAPFGADVDATVKYNFKKGNLGIYKHLPSDILFDWTQKAIEIILEEIENLKGKPAVSIFEEMGERIQWNGYGDNPAPLNWFLTQVIASLTNQEEFIITLPDEVKCLLTSDKLFLKLPRVYCNTCDSYEVPYCENCGEPLTYNRKGMLECSCDAPLKITCMEQHHDCEIRPWYIPKPWLISRINSNIQKIYKNHDLDYAMCIMGDELHIVQRDASADAMVEIPFDNIDCFHSDSAFCADNKTRAFAVRLNEKCEGTCSYEKIDRCVKDSTMICLPKLFLGILPGYNRPQPHKGDEFGDVSGQITANGKSYQMIGIIKKNSENKSGSRSKPRTDDDLIQKPLLSSDKEGEEIIRQFVEQGMADAKVDAIAVIAPQYFDRSLAGTLRMLAKLAGKKVIFIGLDEVCQIIGMNKAVN